MKRYVLSHVPMAVVYTLILFGVKSGWHNPWEWLWFGLGVILGVLILFLDRVVYTYSYPAEQLSQHFLWYLKQKKYLTALALIDSRRMEQEKLTFRSALFMVVWGPVAFFALTSTTGLFGKGVVMGLMLHILTDSWRMLKRDPARLNVRLFWLIKREVSNEERLVFLWIMTVLFVFLSFWVR